jgi:uncharacterized protein (TIGR02246 family)
MRASILLLALLAGADASNLQAQGNPRDFNRPGPAREREMYFAQVRTELNNVLIRWRDAWEKDDATGIAAFYTTGATYYPLSAPQAQTRAAIRNHYAEFLRSVGTLNVNLSGFGMSGDLAYVTARLSYFVFDGTAERRVTRTDLIVLRRQRDHDWLIEAQIAQEEPAARTLP